MELTERVEKQRRKQEELYRELQENPIDLDGLFNTVAHTIQHDYVGFPAKRRYFMLGEYHTYILSHYRYNSLTMEMLARSLHQFAGDLHDRHLRFFCDDWIDYRNLAMKYRVRAYGDYLYVTEAAPETGLTPGDKIVTVQRMTPAKVRTYMRKTAFNSDIPERELWGGYLRMAQTLEVTHADGTTERMKMNLYPAEPVDYPVRFQMLDEKTAYFRLERMDIDVMEPLIRENETAIANSRKLILDLRRCVGGDEDTCFGLLPYMIDREMSLKELLADEGSYVLFTKNNCDRRYNVLNAFRDTTDDPEQLALIEAEMNLYKKNYGRGLLYLPPEPFAEERILPAGTAPEKIVVITDTFCEDEGEQFAAMCVRCGSKVTVIGRPTMGTLDYYDCVNLALNEHMTLSYPIRMTKAAYEGSGISEKGLPVDQYIPWTPEEIRHDVLLELALKL